MIKWATVSVAMCVFGVGAVPGHDPAARSQARQEITYDVTVLRPVERRMLQVVIRIPVTLPGAPISLQMPVWAPGDYRVQFFARYVRDFRATDTSDPPRLLSVTRPDANTWTVGPSEGSAIQVTYDLPGEPMGLFSASVQVTSRYAFVNGPAAYMYVVGEKRRPDSLTIHAPPAWEVEAPLARVPGSSESDPIYKAPDYDTLADSPVVMAAPDAIRTRSFTFNGVPHTVVYFDQPGRISNLDASTATLQRIVSAETKIMGMTPYPRYDFLLDVGGSGGGLEHLDACRIGLPDGAAYLAPLAAHEFFHCWNVKRIRPQVLGPFDYIQPPHTRNLWFAEGVTEYYAYVALRRAGLISDDDFFNHWHDVMRELQGNPARQQVTADEASLRVWEGGESQGYGGLSYYLKGELIGLCLDLTIRHVTHDTRSLDDVMRLLLKRHNPPRPGYGEDEIRDTVNEVAGTDLTPLYNLLARSTQEMPIARCLGYAGLDDAAQPVSVATPEDEAVRTGWLGEAPATGAG